MAKALQKEPARRYPSVLALSEDIRRHAEGLPVGARRDTFTYRVGKFVRRHTAGVATAGVVVLAMVVGLVATAWQAREAKQERDRAEQERDRAQHAQTLAESAQRQSELARKQTQQTNDFLQKLLSSASPTKLGKDAKIIQALDAASADVDKELVNEPEVLAQVHQTLGDTYHTLGLAAPSEQHCEKALALDQQLYGPEDQRTLEAERLLARERVKRNRYDEAIGLLRHVIDCLRRPPGGREPELAQALSVLAFAFGQTDHFPEAEQAIDEAKALNARVHGENSLEYAICLGESALVLEEENKLAEAVEAFQQVQEIVTRVAPNAPQILAAEFNRCTCLVDLDRYAEAGAVLETMRRDCHRIVGENDNIYYTEVLFYSEWLDIQRGEIAKAAGYSKEVLTRYSAYKPATNFYVQMASYFLGVSLVQTGRAAEAEPFLRAVLTNKFDSRQAARCLVYGNVETALGDCLLAQKRYIEAEGLLLAGYDKLRRNPAARPAVTAEVAARLRDLYLAWNKPAEAARYAPEATMPIAPGP